MSLSSRIRNRLIDAINMSFADIGADTHTKMPTTKQGKQSNTAPQAWEYFIANHLYRLAEARRKKAEAAAVKCGIIFDKEKFPKEPGTNGQIFNNDTVAVHLAVGNPQTRTDPAQIIEFLRSKGVKDDLLKQALEVAEYKTRASHTFTASLVISLEE